MIFFHTLERQTRLRTCPIYVRVQIMLEYTRYICFNTIFPRSSLNTRAKYSRSRSQEKYIENKSTNVCKHGVTRLYAKSAVSREFIVFANLVLII